MTTCVDHLNFIDVVCPDCGLEVDHYGNTEERFRDHCCYPDCGCDGARNCDAKSGANWAALNLNIEKLGRRLDRRTGRMVTPEIGAP